MVDKIDKVDDMVVVDVDFFTLKPVEVAAFNPKAWLQKWERVAARDLDTLLTLGQH